jgi:hypothetical protein
VTQEGIVKICAQIGTRIIHRGRLFLTVYQTTQENEYFSYETFTIEV